MYKVKINREINTLYIQLEGFFQKEEAESVVKEVLNGATRLKRGFIVINDITKFKPASPDVANLIQECQKEIFVKGASKAIRIVGDAFMSNMQFNRTQKQAEANYLLQTVKTYEEAMQMVERENATI